MSNLRPAPIFLDQKTVAAVLHGIGAPRTAGVEISSLPEYGARIADIRLNMLKTYLGCEPGYPSDGLLAARAQCTKREVAEHKQALRKAGYLIELPRPGLTQAGRQRLFAAGRKGAKP
jgi:biotin operon repressor